MKKTFLIITSLIMLCIMIVGCQTSDTTVTTSNELNKHLNLLSNTVSRLDTVDNEYLVSNELYTINSNNLPSQKRMHKNILARSNNEVAKKDRNIAADTISLNDDLKQALSNELINRIYCDSNGNCKICNEKFVCNENNMCNSCNQTIICDSNGNCTSCKETLSLDNDNNCGNCKTKCISNTANNNISEETKSCLRKISTNNQDLMADLIYTNNSNDLIDNNDTLLLDDDNDDIIYDSNDTQIATDTTSANTENNTELNNNTTNLDNNTPKYQIVYYEENSYIPNIRYSPRFARNINYETANNNINSYMSKLQKLYTMTADVVEANNALANYKVIILDNIDETRELNNCILSGNCTPTNNQVLALNNYIEDIKSTVFNLRKCNGNLTNEINKISTSNTGISHSIDVTNSNYLRILNQIDTRISYHENAIATLEQIQYLLQDAQNNKTQDNTLIEDLNNSTDILIDSNIDTFEEDRTTDNTLDDNQIIDNNANTNTGTHSSDTNTDDIYTYGHTSNSTDINNETNSIIVNNDNITDNNNVENDTITHDNYKEAIEEPIEESDTESITNNNVIPNKNINSDEMMENTNIDTYQNNLNNLDLMNEDGYNLDNNDPILNDDNINNNLGTNNDRIVDNHIYNTSANTNYNNDNLENNNLNNNLSPQMVDGNIENNFANTNSIISQNNLDNNYIGNNSYRYNSDGSLYNNTNGYENNSINNINNSNSNVNTYKYNTLIDSINRGTVDNGINNL